MPSPQNLKFMTSSLFSCGGVLKIFRIRLCRPKLIALQFSIKRKNVQKKRWTHFEWCWKSSCSLKKSSCPCVAALCAESGNLAKLVIHVISHRIAAIALCSRYFTTVRQSRTAGAESEKHQMWPAVDNSLNFDDVLTTNDAWVLRGCYVDSVRG